VTDSEILLCMAIEELRQLREERVLHQQRQEEFATMLHGTRNSETSTKE